MQYTEKEEVSELLSDLRAVIVVRATQIQIQIQYLLVKQKLVELKRSVYLINMIRHWCPDYHHGQNEYSFPPENLKTREQLRT